MLLTFLAVLLDSAPPLVSKPSDVLGWIMIGGIILFITWVCVRAAGSFEAFMRSVPWILALAVLAVFLIVIFQAGHPGQ